MEREGIQDEALKKTLHEAQEPVPEIGPEVWARIRGKIVPEAGEAGGKPGAVRGGRLRVISWPVAAAAVAASFVFGFMLLRLVSPATAPTVLPVKTAKKIEEPPPGKPPAVAEMEKVYPTMRLVAEKDRLSLKDLAGGGRPVIVNFDVGNVGEVPLYLQPWPQADERLSYPRYMLQVTRLDESGRGEPHTHWIQLSRRPELFKAESAGAELRIGPGGRYVLPCDVTELLREEGTYVIQGFYTGPVRPDRPGGAPSYNANRQTEPVRLVITR